ncbi:permease-like cell division protein FtsX [Nonomuraea sp. NPDC049784]|uniref:permease-like cell division protein FtsX n=1 Tax=Nonomuraea sp. NPDC049784 TaxID=3154361 RepID=UPI0033D1CA3B
MTSRVEDRLREALVETGATVDTSTLRPLRASQRGRFRVDFRLVTAAVVVLAGAATAVWLGGPGGGEDRAVAANPALAKSTDMAVFLCTKSAPKETKCQGRDVSREETEAVERTLRELPQVEAMFFMDQVATYEKFRVRFAHNKALLDTVKPTDLPTSVRLKIKKGADPKEVEKALRGMSGVLGAMEQAPPPADPQKPLISVFLCAKASPMPTCGAERESLGKGDFKLTKDGKAATAAQKQAIAKTIKAMLGVKEVVFEDQAAAYENFRRLYRDNKTLLRATKVTDMPESFRVTMKPEAEWAPVVSKLERQPGVSQVFYAPCFADDSELRTAYGLSLPDDKVCPVGK